MSQRPTNQTSYSDMDDIERRLSALERVNPGNVSTVTDISKIVNGVSTSVSTNTVQVKSVQDRLAALESAGNNARVSTLPTTNLTDGLVVAWQTSPASPLSPPAYGSNYGVTWIMKYNLGKTYPWECIGGQDMTSWVESSGSQRPSAGFSQLSGSNVQDLPIPYNGEWRMIADVGYVENSNGSFPNFMNVMPCRIGEAFDARKAATVHGEPYGISPYGAYGAPAHKERSIICTRGDVVGLRYQASQDYASFYGIMFALRPVRVNTL